MEPPRYYKFNIFSNRRKYLKCIYGAVLLFHACTGLSGQNNARSERFRLAFTHGNATPMGKGSFSDFKINGNNLNLSNGGGPSNLGFYSSNQNYIPTWDHIKNGFFPTDPSNKYQLDLIDTKNNISYGINWVHQKLEISGFNYAANGQPVQFKWEDGGMAWGITIGKIWKTTAKTSLGFKTGPSFLFNKMNINADVVDGSLKFLQTVHYVNQSRSFNGYGYHFDGDFRFAFNKIFSVGAGLGGSYYNIRAATSYGKITGSAFVPYYSLTIQIYFYSFFKST